MPRVRLPRSPASPFHAGHGDSAVAFLLTVFAGFADGAGEPVAASDAAEAAFYRLDELGALSLVDNIVEIAAELLGREPGA